MADVIARVRAEMQARLKQIEGELRSVEALIAEKGKLDQALSTPPFAETPSAPSRRQAASSKPAGARKRAAKGANKTAVHEAVRNMPGASSGEIATASRVDKAQVYNILRAGVENGHLVAVDLGGGTRGYRINEPPETVFPATASEVEADLKQQAGDLARKRGIVAREEPRAEAPKVSSRRMSRKKADKPASESETPAADAQVEEPAAA
jgi:hypothetical protein